MVIQQGDVWWADLPVPAGREPGFRRPVVVVQSDTLNHSAIGTTVVVPLTSAISAADCPGCRALSAAATGLPKDSVAKATEILTVDRTVLVARSGRLGPLPLQSVLDAIDEMLGR